MKSAASASSADEARREPSTTPMPRVVVIQHLRGLAALGVVIFHIMEATPTKFTVGSAGVDTFFVISGFIMWTLSDGRRAKPGGFLVKRLLRVAPPYWLATVMICAAAMIKPNIFMTGGISLSSLLKSLVFIPYVDFRGQIQPILFPGWTLNYEIFFYVIFALVLLLRHRLAALTAIMVALVALHGLGPDFGALGAIYTDPLLLEFTAGAWLGAAYRRGRLLGAAGSLVLLLTGLGTFAALQIAGYRPDGWRALAWGAPAAAVVCGALGLERAGRAPSLRPLQVMGDWSYSLYLTHLLVLDTLSVLAPRSFALYAGAGVVVSILAAAVFYKVVENPIHRAVSRLRPRRLPPALSAV